MSNRDDEELKDKNALKDLYRTIASANNAVSNYQNAKQVRGEIASEFDDELHTLRSMRIAGVLSAVLHGIAVAYFIPIINGEVGTVFFPPDSYFGFVLGAIIFGWSGGIGLMGLRRRIRERGYAVWLSPLFIMFLLIFIIFYIYVSGVVIIFCQALRVYQLGKKLEDSRWIEDQVRKDVFLN